MGLTRGERGDGDIRADKLERGDSWVWLWLWRKERRGTEGLTDWREMRATEGLGETMPSGERAGGRERDLLQIRNCDFGQQTQLKSSTNQTSQRQITILPIFLSNPTGRCRLELSFIHKIFTTKEKEGSSSSDCSAPLQALEVFAQIGAQKRQILWNKWSQRSRLHCAVAAQDPVGLGLPLEDDVVLIVGHFRDSSEQRIRFPSSNDCVCGKENSGRVEDPRRICQASSFVNANAAKWTKASISTSCCNTQIYMLVVRLVGSNSEARHLLTGSLSSFFTYEFFGSKESSASSGIFGSLFAPSSSIVKCVLFKSRSNARTFFLG
ncbi:hypothetical protein DVH24_038253 [Malus domestica]|uniref:Uncharacterized protein n=1 Tax=Malus domestica TaxID=3750 RepID=A0A498K6T2_MALDO|nr:hypothetical protein DVH24_038253 [Malus domestica]